jgi:predicted metal-binding protein
MVTLVISRRTPAATIKINVKYTIVDASGLQKYEDYGRFADLCRAGCKNYARKWSCPPYSPTFGSAFSGYKSALLILLHSNPNQYCDIADDWLRVKKTNSTQKSLVESILRGLERDLPGVCLLNGSCGLCESCSCPANLPCADIVNRRFSMEAVGLNVTRISEDYFNHRLLWYRPKEVPEYTSVISCILSNRQISDSVIRGYLKKGYDVCFK